MDTPIAKLPDYQSAEKSPVAAGALGISPEQLAQFRVAEQRAKKVRRAVNVARTDGWIGAVLALTATMSVIFDRSAIFIGPVLGLIAWNSFRGARRLKQFDLGAPKILAWNQVFLATAIILYCFYQLYVTFYGGDSLTRELEANGLSAGDLQSVLGADLPKLERTLYAGFYGAVMVGTIVFQGLTALYYLSRRKPLEQYLRETPEWIVTLQKAQT